jgi:diguanylate cyclase (GGDEF)-like protein/PAS domain S-box-containing protein
MTQPSTDGPAERRHTRDLLTGSILLIAVSAVALVACGQIAAARIMRAQAAMLPAAEGAVMRHRIDLVNLTVLGSLALLFVGVILVARRARRAVVLENAELERRVAERTVELARTEARTAAFVTTAVEAIITMDEGGTIRSINPATEGIFGYTEAELVGTHIGVIVTGEDLAHDDDDRRSAPAVGPALVDTGLETVARRKDGTVFPIDLSVSEARVGEDRLFVGLIRDITERKRVEAELKAAKAAAEEAATHDPLTALWNHNRIIEVLIEELARAGRRGDPVSLAMVDLDHFKRVNDTYGHVVGDEVLREVAERLGRAVRVYDAVGRFGGEEFMVVFPGTDAAEAEIAAERLRSAIGQEPVLTPEGPVGVTASVGVVTGSGGPAGDATTLLVAADTALYRAKECGRDRVEIASMQPT